jgi:pilus assembly protein Flp/PilA
MFAMVRNATGHMRRLFRGDDGAAMVEYGLLLGLIVVVGVLTIQGLGQEVSTVFSVISTKIGGIVP